MDRLNSSLHLGLRPLAPENHLKADVVKVNAFYHRHLHFFIASTRVLNHNYADLQVIYIMKLNQLTFIWKAFLFPTGINASCLAFGIIVGGSKFFST